VVRRDAALDGPEGLIVACLPFLSCALLVGATRDASGPLTPRPESRAIDRRALVTRHHPTLTRLDPESPLTVGNGEFAFTADVTGLQTFAEAYDATIPLGTLAQWGWHTAPNPDGWAIDGFGFHGFDSHGRRVGYADIPSNERTPEINWLRANPHRLHLGRIGFRLVRAAGTPAAAGDLSGVRQTLDLSESADLRWRELERRIVLSQYPTAIQCAGSLPGNGALLYAVAMMAAGCDGAPDIHARVSRETAAGRCAGRGCAGPHSPRPGPRRLGSPPSCDPRLSPEPRASVDWSVGVPATEDGPLDIKSPEFYAEIGLISGLEVHQQLLTERKMFCHCPARRYTDTHDGEVLRHMRPTLSELGEYDGTALMEFKTRKNIIYLLHKQNVCTYEMDDTPPFLVNQDAVDVAIEQCLMLGCDIVDEVHIARKQYLDGSIPTGFQRTAIVGVNGRLPFRGRELTILQVSVEEDSCREVSDEGHLIVWRTDRLGMPLIETVTGPDLRTPDEVADAILLVGRVCRSTGHVRVGLGASRQDVNVSVRGGRRVEIKGVPKASWAPGLVHGEAIRQVNLLKLRDELLRRGVTTPESVGVESADVTALFASSEAAFLTVEGWEKYTRDEKRRAGFELGAGKFTVRAIRVKGLGGTLAWPTQPDCIFAHELAGRIRVIAGLDQRPILLHSEKWPDYHRSLQELRRVRTHLKCNPEDGIVLVWGPDEDTMTAANEVRLRYVDALNGIPNETRQPFEDGMTDFERILPGPDRMYPDTDSPPSRVTRARVERLQAALAPRPWEREARYAAAGVPTSTIHFLIRRGGARLVDKVTAARDERVKQACVLFGEQLKGLRRDGVPVDNVPDERWCELFDAASALPVLWQAWGEIVRAMAAAPGAAVAAIVAGLELGRAPDDWRRRVTDAVAAARDRLYAPGADRLFRFSMGLAMRELRGKVSALDVAGAVTAEIEGGGRGAAGGTTTVETGSGR
jgi:glutamyl-tRNA(Gln) amidotransferase subunit E